jgi:hypothetical protein
MVLKYSDKPQLARGQGGSDNWRSRFPAHSRSMESVPMMGARPIKLFDPSGQARWGLHHLGAWRGGAWNRNSFTGQWEWRLDGALINNPVRWASS